RVCCDAAALALAIPAVSLHDALPICVVFPSPVFFEELKMKSRAIVALGFGAALVFCSADAQAFGGLFGGHGGCCEASCACEPSRSEEHTSELQSRVKLVCGLLLEKRK